MTGLSKLNPNVSDSSEDFSSEPITSESSESTNPGSLASSDSDIENYDEMLQNVENVLRIGASDDEEDLDDEILKEMCEFLVEHPDKSLKDLLEEEAAKVVELENSDEDSDDVETNSEADRNPGGATVDPKVVIQKSELQKDSEDVKDIEYWDMLPKELKMDVIGRLDLFSRHSMRGTCRENRSIVDYKEFFVPRVKFAQTQSKYSIMIFMEVEKWAEFRVQQDKEKRTIVSRFENTLDPKKATSYVSSLGVSEWVVALMVGLFSHDSILIGTLEWAIFSDSKSKENFKNHQELHDKLQLQATGSLMNSFNEYSGKTTIFRVKKAFTMGESTLNIALSVILDEKDLLGIEHLCGDLVENPVCISDMYNPKCELRGLSQNYTRRLEGMPSLPHLLVSVSKLKGIAHLKFAKLDNETMSLWNSINSKIQIVGDFRIKNQSKLVVREKVLLLVRHTMSPCGYWITVIPTNDAERMGADFVRNLLNENKCRMGSLCQKCSDPFEYWYHKNFIGWQLAVEDPTVPTVIRAPTVTAEVQNEMPLE